MDKSSLSLIVATVVSFSAYECYAEDTNFHSTVKSQPSLKGMEANREHSDTASSSTTTQKKMPNSMDASIEIAEQDLDFDSETLRSRGLDPSVAGYFSKRARFSPGRKIVNMSLNGKNIGSISVLFDSSGNVCVDKAFLEMVGLREPNILQDTIEFIDNEDSLPSAVANSDIESISGKCYNYSEAFPGTVFTLLPTEDRIEMVTPAAALLPNSNSGGNYSTGGTAALLNYSLFASRNQFSGGGSDYKQGMFEAGFNINDWLVRSKQIVSQSNNNVNTDSLYTFAQHTFTDIKKIAQIGQINVGSTLFSGNAINGVQLIPETALDNNGGSGVSVSGIAQTSQARVDIKQSGSLIYSTLVPIGPFSLADIPVISANTDLEVSVNESNGSINTFIVPASSLIGSKLGKPQGLSLALGTLRNVDTPFDKPWLATFSNGWQLTNYLNMSGGLMTARKYNSVAGGLSVTPVDSLLLSAKALSSRDQLNNVQGQQATLSASYITPYSISLGIAATQNSQGYRDLVDIFDNRNDNRSKNDYSLSAGWSHEMLGSFSLGYSRSVYFNSSDDSKRLTTSWSKSFKYVSVSASWQHEIDSDSRKYSNTGYRHDYQSGGDTFYLNLNIPIGTQSVNAYMRDDGRTTSYGAQTVGNITPNLGYNVSAESNNNSDAYSVNGGLNANLRYTRGSINAGQTGKNSRNSSATLDGGVVVHRDGITFSPYAVQETFGIATLDKQVSGVEISTPRGSVWTDSWGNAVVPSLNAYRNSNVMLNTETLPKHIDINNGMKSVAAGHGSVSHLQFGVLSVRRAMLKLIMPNGKLVQKGTIIFDDSNQYVTTAVENGVVFISDVKGSESLYALTDDAGHKCQINFTISEEPDLDEFYENVDATCKA